MKDYENINFAYADELCKIEQGYGGREVQNKPQFWKQNKLQMQMQI